MRTRVSCLCTPPLAVLSRGAQLPQSAAARQCRCLTSSSPLAHSHHNNHSRRQHEASSTPSSSSSSSQSSPQPPGPSLYDKLFPNRPVPPRPQPSRPSEPRHPSRPSHPSPSRRPLRNPRPAERPRAPMRPRLSEPPEIRIPSPATTPGLKESAPRKTRQALFVMKNLSRSLAPTDFYRLAPKGRHVSAWATGGINKIIQSINPTTREPQGQYFLFFDSFDAATRYRDEITSLLARANPPAESAEAPTGQPPPPAPPLSLLPPGAHLECALYPVPTPPKALGLTVEITATQDRAPYLLTPHLADPDLEFGPSARVTLRLAGSRLTLTAMRAALDADADARNMPWSLVNTDHKLSSVRGLAFGAAPIKYGMAGRLQQGGRPEEQQEKEEEGEKEENEEEEGSEEDGNEGKEKDGQSENQRSDTGYSRFVLTFTEPGEALRFVRAWHRREMVDERTNRSIVFHASALW